MTMTHSRPQGDMVELLIIWETKETWPLISKGEHSKQIMNTQISTLWRVQNTDLTSRTTQIGIQILQNQDK